MQKNHKCHRSFTNFDLQIASQINSKSFENHQNPAKVNRHGRYFCFIPQPLGKVAYHVACHQRVQNFGMKTRDFLQLIPDTEVTAIARCSGHDGTYAVKAETFEKAKKIARPVVRRVAESKADTFGSDCPMAGRLIADGMDKGEAQHPISMVRKAYGI